ncbi:MAG: hypothetical protein ACRDJP_02145 [Actinomycetota bacterium]
MPRRLPLALCAIMLAAASCGEPPIRVTGVEPEEGAFVPQVVDFEGDVGSGIALTTDADGNPHMTYLAFEETPEGETPAAPDPLAPTLPAVMHAHLVDNIWTRGPVAEEQDVEAGTDVTSLAVDAEGAHHVAWTAGGSLLYTDDTSGEAEPQTVAGSATAPAIAAGEDGTPWIAFWEEQTDPEGPTALLRLATPSGKGWDVETVAEGEPQDVASIGLAIGPDGPIVAYDSAGEIQVATQRGSRWASETVDAGDGGVSIDVDADGNPHMSYLAGGAVKHAHSVGGGQWELSDVGTGAGAAPTSIAVDDEGVHHVAWESEETGGLAYASNAEGDFVDQELPPATTGGTQPKLAAGASGALYMAWYDTVDTELQMLTGSDDEPLLALPSPTGAAPGGEAPAACEPQGNELSISAQNLQFSTDCLAVEAAQPYSVTLDNQDAAPHNVSVYADESASEAFLEGQPIADPGQSVTYEGEPIPDPGDLYFQCDIHPTMNGSFVVAEAGGGGGGGGGE